MSDLESLLNKVYESAEPELADLEVLLSLEKEEARCLFDFADRQRRAHMGEGIFLRGIVEFSNFCARTCCYCGLNRNNKMLKRYRLTRQEVCKSVENIHSCGLSTVVLQSGEDDCLDPFWLGSIISEIKSTFDIAVTLSVGEKDRDIYKMWRQAGADRYLLKIETSDKELYESLHPGMSFENRLHCLRALKELGYQTGCGIIVGLKGQTLKSIARDILFFKKEDFDMIGIGPFIPHPQTQLKGQDAGSVFLTLKTVALTRIVTKNAHLPATTALGSLEGDSRTQALSGGANVLMPNFTPQPYRPLYEIYPNKRCVQEQVTACAPCMETMAASLGRPIDYARGDSFKKG